MWPHLGLEHDLVCLSHSLPELTKSTLPGSHPPSLLLPLKRLNNKSTIRHETIQIGIIPHHLLSIPRTRRRRAVLDVHDIIALKECIDQSAPNALVAVDAAEEERRYPGLLQVEPEGRLRSPEAGESVYRSSAVLTTVGR